ncbi:MAG TPA: PepSY-associated TM helix domain-containing protein [Caulobacteraceae bacterium]|nr:PepSY-associated TM helix domain-containing protein [Caulobacteraceae bacterium]
MATNTLTSGPVMRRTHRAIAVFAVLFALFVACTGLAIQMMDLGALLGHAPAADPTIQAIHAGLNGPPNFQVIRDADYSAQPLPADFDYQASLKTVMASARTALKGRPASFVQWRMTDGKPVGEVATGKTRLAFDAVSGAQLGPPVKFKFEPISTPSLRNTLKDYHRMRGLNGWLILLDMTVGLTLIAMILTGLTLYLRLYQPRAKSGQASPFWSAGGVWRSLHRSVAICASLFLLVMATSGTILSVSSMGVTLNGVLNHGKRPGITNDLSQPLTDAELPGLLGVTLAANRAAGGEPEIRVLRLRYYAGMPQGVVVTGGDAEQRVFNAQTGRRVSLTEPNYPAPGQTFGWQVDETVKMIHRGDYFGLTGRWIDLISGFCLLYLAISGAAVYLKLWANRRRSGRPGLFWS